MELTTAPSTPTRLAALDTQDALAALAALAQESRLAIFRLLIQAGPAGIVASKISERLAIPPSSLSFHLKELTHAKLISATQDGRFVIYRASFSTMNGLIAFLTENCCGGNPCSPTGTATCTPSMKDNSP